MNVVANDLRAMYSPSYIIERLCAEAKRIGRNAIIEAIHTEGEARSLRREPNFVLLAVDADREARYHRIVARGSEKDHISFEKFKADEAREFSSTDPAKQNLSRCIELADYKLKNNGSVEELYARVDEILERLRDARCPPTNLLFLRKRFRICDRRL
jgi:dephospho-CoA kinase